MSYNETAMHSLYINGPQLWTPTQHNFSEHLFPTSSTCKEADNSLLRAKFVSEHCTTMKVSASNSLLCEIYVTKHCTEMKVEHEQASYYLFTIISYLLAIIIIY